MADLTKTMPTDSGNNQFLALVDPATGNLLAIKPGASRTTISGSPTSLQASGMAAEVADGADVAEGATTDVAVTGDTAGSVSAKLRGLSKMVNDVWDSVGHRLKVDGSGVTQPVSGTVTAGTNADTTIGGTTAPTKELLIGGKTSDVTPQYQPLPLSNGGAAVKVDGSATTQPISGTVSVNALPAGANLIGQVEVSDGTNILGTAAHPVKTDPTGTTTQPVSGTVAVSNFPATQPVSGTVTANIGTTNGVALDTSVNGLLVAQGSTTSGEKGPLAQGAVTTAAPAYTTGQTSPLSLTTAGALRTDSSAVTQPISAASLPLPTGAALEAGHLATIDTSTSGINTATGATTDVAVTGDNAGSVSAKLRGLSKMVADVWDSVNHRLHVNVDAGSLTANAGTNLNTSLLALESGGNLAAAKADLDAIKTSVAAFTDATSSGTIIADAGAVSVALAGGQATALVTLTGTFSATLNFEGYNDAAQTWEALSAVNISTNALGTTTAATGSYRVAVGGLTNFRVRAHPYTSGTVTVTITLTQTAQNVTVTNATPLGQAASASSAPVVIASDQIVPTQGSKTVIAGQGTGVVNAQNTYLIPATDVSGYRWLSLQIAGTFSLSLTFECSDDNSNWLSVPMTSVSSAPVINYFTSSTGFIYNTPVTFNYFRVRASSYTSNTSLAGTLLCLTTPPVNLQYAPVTSYQGARTWGGALDYHLISAASTNSNNIRASATQIYGYQLGNNGASDAYVKLYNKATAPTVGTDTPLRTIYVPKGQSVNYHTDLGVYCSAGLGIGITGGAADADTTAVAAAQVTVDVEYI